LKVFSSRKKLKTDIIEFIYYKYRMGLDDNLFDSQFETKLKELLKPHIKTYVDKIRIEKDESSKRDPRLVWYHVDVSGLDEWEEKICYNGYSLAFHTLLPVITIFVMGSCPGPITDEHRSFIKARTREETIKLYNPV